MTLRTLNYGNYGIFLIMGNAGFCPSAVLLPFLHSLLAKGKEFEGSGDLGSFFAPRVHGRGVSTVEARKLEHH